LIPDLSFINMESDERVQTVVEVKIPSMYRVIMHNDHYTTMEFVVMVLMNVFQKPKADATRIMMDVHRKGAGECGIYPRDIAETKVAIVHQKARSSSFPLRCSMEKA